MASSQRPSTGSLSPTTAFRTTDNPDVWEHAEERWQERVLDRRDDIDITIDVAWREAVPVYYGTRNAEFLRYHAESDSLLLAHRTHNGRHAVTELRTVLRPEWRDEHPRVRRAIAAIRRERGRR